MRLQKIKKLIKIYLIFFKIGSFTFGGGLAMIPLFQKEMVEKQKWISEEEIVDVYAIAQSLPGIFSVNSSIFIGYKIAGVLGAVFAGIGVISPSLIAIFLVANALSSISRYNLVQKAFTGIRAGAAGLILVSVIYLGKAAIKDVFSVLIIIFSFFLIIFTQINPIYVIIASGFISFVYYLIKKDKNI